MKFIFWCIFSPLYLHGKCCWSHSIQGLVPSDSKLGMLFSLSIFWNSLSSVYNTPRSCPAHKEVPLHLEVPINVLFLHVFSLIVGHPDTHLWHSDAGTADGAEEGRGHCEYLLVSQERGRRWRKGLLLSFLQHKLQPGLISAVCVQWPWNCTRLR